MVTVPIPIISQPGIQRDGTLFASERYVDGSWVRFDRGLPRKLAGYRQLTDRLSGTPRSLDAYPYNDHVHVHVGSQEFLESLDINVDTLIASAVSDRTPSGFAADTDNLWQFAQMYDSVTADTVLIAHAAPNAVNVANATAEDVYLGDIHGTGALTAIASSDVSGGVVVFHPYLFVFGSDGFVNWSVANKPTDLTGAGSGSARITGKKVVRGLPVRGGAGNAPAGLLWSMDSLVKVSFVGSAPIFDFDTISTKLTVLSPLSVIEFDGAYYWVGQDQFYVYNGIVQEVPNDVNKNFFFDNLNWTHRAKVFSFKVQRFNEWWICYPRGTATECTHAIVYNRDLQTWFDTPLPNEGRGAAVNSPDFRYPLATGVVDDDISGQKILWAHEIGVDEVSGSPATTKAVRSYFETGVLSLAKPPPGGMPQTQWLTAKVLEPDFIQTGDLTVTATGRANARAADVAAVPKTILGTMVNPDDQIVTFKDAARRQLRLRFESNVAGGDYQMGQSLLHVEPSDGTMLGKVQT